MRAPTSLRRPTVRVGWIAYDTLRSTRPTFARLDPPFEMRIANVARWINGKSSRLHNELYRPYRRYDLVVFHKAMDEACRREARRIQAGGGRVVFDANVNYYEIWGEYDIEGTRPTPEQQREAIEMTRLVDWVVADSRYLLGIVRKHTERAGWIPDNVDLRVFGRRERIHRRRPFRLVWSGVAKKAKPLLEIAPALSRLEGAELVLVTDTEPAVAPALSEAIRTRVVPFSVPRYARVLAHCDVILSPKRLVNGYELGHTEWKITLGMASALPAVASPQPSYVEAIGAHGGGIVADGVEEWRDALLRLAGDDTYRRELGRRARQTVEERYSLPVVARQYLDLLESLL